MQPPRPPLSVDVLDAAVEIMGRAGRGGTVRVTGSSMVPTLAEAQLLDAEFVAAPPRRGELVLFRQLDYLVVHRYLGPCRAPDGRRAYRTRGDGRLFLDPAVLPERLIGRVRGARYGDVWRTFRTRRGALYARLVALHDLAWAAGGILARFGDRALRKLRVPPFLVEATAACDRGLLRATHALLFHVAHPVVPAPEQPAGERPAGDDALLY